MNIPATPFIPGEYIVKHVENSWEQRGCLALRRSVFCEEQRVFDGDDRDAIDEQAIAIAAIACVAGMAEDVVGTVRIHRASDAGLWYGSRLAVHPHYRGAAWLGTQLIIHAVSTAHARGCERFLATVQVQNVRLFERLHWRSLEAVLVQGRPHVLMEADLAAAVYAPRALNELRFYSSVRKAA